MLKTTRVSLLLKISAFLFCVGIPFITQAVTAENPVQLQKSNPEYNKLVSYSGLINHQFEHSRSIVEYILAELEKHELPKNLVLIPMLESSFQANAISSMNAVGLWQLRPETADRYGLIVNNRLDERLNLHQSTTAAVKYLSFLYQKFGHNIPLTLAAYNAGEGRVQKYINKDNDYATAQLPEETVQYIYRYYALESIVDLSSYSASKTRLYPIIRQDSDVVSPLIPLKQANIRQLDDLFKNRMVIDTAKTAPLIQLH